MKNKGIIIPAIIALVGAVALLPAQPGSKAFKEKVSKPSATTTISPESAKLLAEAKAKGEAQRKKIASQASAEDAKVKAEGWFQVANGIYGRWCTETCSNAEVIGNAAYWLMEVWAKDRSAGDIYAQINVLQNGTVIGWTNDTAYLSRGQKGILTFTKYLPGSGGQYKAQLVKFSASH